MKGRIELRNVSFSYDGIRKVLKDVSFTVEPGHMIGLAGPSGGGKTTLVNLICRFYDVLEGRILIDGVDVRDYDVADLRRKIGVVLQEPFLFHGTVAENIAYGKPEATMDEIIAAARAANANDFILDFPDAYDTIVGERGQSLSGGERQRISIARAILHDPAVLILDEATSSVDTQTEKLIQEALERLTANRTTIAIAHRLSTLRLADKLIVLDKGSLVEEGIARGTGEQARRAVRPPAGDAARVAGVDGHRGRGPGRRRRWRGRRRRPRHAGTFARRRQAMNEHADDTLASVAGESPRVTSLAHDESGRLVVRIEGCDRPQTDVRLVRYFPWSMPESYISVRTEDGKELAVIPGRDELDPASREVLDAELHHKVFNPRILRILDFSHEFGISSVKAETDRGEVFFQFRGRNAFRLLSPTRALIRDVDNNTYELPDFSALDATSQKHLQRYF